MLTTDCDLCGEMYCREDLEYDDDGNLLCMECMSELMCAKCKTNTSIDSMWRELRICKDCLTEIDKDLAKSVFGDD